MAQRISRRIATAIDLIDPNALRCFVEWAQLNPAFASDPEVARRVLKAYAAVVGAMELGDA